MENMKLKISEWWNAPQKKDFKSLLFGKETLRLMLTVLITSFLVMCVMFIVQMSSVEPETEDTIAFIGVSVISLVGLWKALANIRMLERGLEKFAYACIAAAWGYLAFQLSMFLFVAFVIYLVCCFFGMAKFDLVKELFPGRSQDGGENESGESPDYGTLCQGVSGDYIQGKNGESLRVTDDLGGGDVRTENGQCYHIDSNGYATKI